MQKKFPVNLPPLSFNLIIDAVGISAVDFSAEFHNLYKRTFRKNFYYRKAHGDLIRYFPGLSKT